MQNNFNDITIAFAGLFQAVALIKEITQTGKITNEAAFHASIYSIFQTNPTDTLAVFGGASGIQFGLTKLQHALRSTQPLDRAQRRYLLSLIHLQKKNVTQA